MFVLKNVSDDLNDDVAIFDTKKVGQTSIIEIHVFLAMVVKTMIRRLSNPSIELF